MHYIATHNGVFHADDVFAVAALQLMDPTLSVIRTREPKVILEAAYVVDVGGTHDPNLGRFDHHQKGRAGARPNGVLFSSFGLVWAALGKKILHALRLNDLQEEGLLPRIIDTVDRTLVQPIDALDNGQELYSTKIPSFEGIHGFGVGSVISSFNPTWLKEKSFEHSFFVAVSVANDVLLNVISDALAKEVAKSVIREALQCDQGKPVLVLDTFVPWAEQVRDESTHTLYCVFPSETGTWMVQGVNKTPGTFDLRRPLPEAWAGLRDGEFQAATGVEDGVFCHPGRFICGAQTKEGALRLAELALR